MIYSRLQRAALTGMSKYGLNLSVLGSSAQASFRHLVRNSAQYHIPAPASSRRALFRRYSSCAVAGNISDIDSYSAQISQILNKKPKDNFVISEDQTVFEAVRKMAEANVGCLVVINDGHNIDGIISERDYLTKIILQDRASKTTHVREIMSKKVLSVTPDFSVGECMQLMVKHNIRHLPVVDDDNEFIGLISIKDLVKQVADDHEKHVLHLNEQIKKLANAVFVEDEMEKPTPSLNFSKWLSAKSAP